MRTGRIESRVQARDTGDALDQLSLLFNAMLDRIQALIGGMRGALDNVAHDLRTPMMRMRGIAETALQSPDDPVVLREALADCLEESERVVTMLNTLMDISEAETGTMRLQVESVNVADLVRNTIDLYETSQRKKASRCTSAIWKTPTSSSTGTACARCWRTWWTTRSSTPRAADESTSPSGAAMAAPLLRCATQAAESPPTICRASGTASIEVTRAAPNEAWGSA